jgi:hypothetical protein
MAAVIDRGRCSRFQLSSQDTDPAGPREPGTSNRRLCSATLPNSARPNVPRSRVPSTSTAGGCASTAAAITCAARPSSTRPLTGTSYRASASSRLANSRSASSRTAPATLTRESAANTGGSSRTCKTSSRAPSALAAPPPPRRRGPRFPKDRSHRGWSSWSTRLQKPCQRPRPQPGRSDREWRVLCANLTRSRKSCAIRMAGGSWGRSTPTRTAPSIRLKAAPAPSPAARQRPLRWGLRCARQR